MTGLILSVLFAAAPFDPTTVLFDGLSDLSCPTKEGGFTYQALMGRYAFSVYTDSKGYPTHVYRLKDLCSGPETSKSAGCNAPVLPQGRELWDSAEPSAPELKDRDSNCARQGWGWETHNPTPYDVESFANGSRTTLALKTYKITLRSEAVTSKLKGCKDLRIYGVVNGSKVLLAEDMCTPKDLFFNDVVQWDSENAISPAGDCIAISFMAGRYAPGKPGEVTAASVTRGRVVVIDRRTFATIDLLDAGLGSGADALASKLTDAGFRVSHRGKAETPRTKINIYFGKGFETEAREIAKLVGVEPGAVQPLSWKSPYAITVAAGGRHASQ